MEDRRHRLSSTISLLGHPFLLIPLTVAAATRNWRWTAVVLACTSLPLTAITLRNVRRGRWTDADVSSRAQRPGLYLAAVPLLALVIGLLWLLHAPPRMIRGAGAAGGMLAIGILANRWLKVSLHMMFAAFCGITIIDAYPRTWIAVAAFVAAIAWSRWALRRHTIAEIVTGLVLGTAAGLIAML